MPFTVIIEEPMPNGKSYETRTHYRQTFATLDIADVVIFLNELTERKDNATPLGKSFSSISDPPTVRLYPDPADPSQDPF